MTKTSVNYEDLLKASEDEESLLTHFASCQFGNLKKPVTKNQYNASINLYHSILKKTSLEKIDELLGNFLEITLKVLDEVLMPLGSQIENGKEQMDTDKANLDTGNSKKITLKGIIIILRSTLLIENISIASLTKLCVILHESLPDIDQIFPDIAHDVNELCTTVWIKNLPFKQEIWMNSFMYILRRNFDPSKESSEVNTMTMLYKMHSGLKFVDFSEIQVIDGLNPTESLDENQTLDALKELRDLLILSFSDGSFYNDRNGNKFLQNVFILNKELNKDIHDVITKMITPKFPNKQWQTLGEIIYHAWRSADEEMKQTIEENCIQDLMFRAVHAPRPKKDNLFSCYHALLFSITTHKASTEVRHMITRLYAPIIWRGLKANNGMVRANASRLLFDAFPMEEMGSTNSEAMDFNLRQLQTMKDIMLDDCPSVRAIGILGVTLILSQYWDSLPPHVIAIFAQTIYNKLAFDISSADVRKAVYIGTQQLLKHKESHPLLAKILPDAAKHGIHDSSEKVRLAVLEVLNSLRKFCTIKFWEVCPVPDLLLQLAADKNKQVCKEISSLLFGSFLPKEDSHEEWVKKCVNFHKRNTIAARKFYMHTSEQMTTQNIAKFLEKIGLILQNYIKWSMNDENDADESTDSSKSSRGDPETLYAFLETSCILWKQYQRNLTKQRGTDANAKTMLKNVLGIYSKSVHICLRYVADERGVNAVITLASFLEPQMLPLFSKSLVTKLGSIPDNAPVSYYSPLIRCVCKWNYCSQLLEQIHDWLDLNETDINNDDDQPKDKKKKKSRKSKQTDSKKGVRFQVQTEKRPTQALKYLTVLLDNQSDASHNMFKSKSCMELINSIASSLCKHKDSALRKQTNFNHSFPVSSALDLWFSIQIIKHHVLKDENAIGEIKCMLQWFLKNVFTTIKLSQSIQEKALNTSILSSENSSLSMSTLLHTRSAFKELTDIFLLNCVNLLSTGIPVYNEVETFLLELVSVDSGLNLIDYFQKIVTLMNLLNQKHFDERLLNNNDKMNDSALSDNNQTITNDNVKPTCLVLYNSMLCYMLKQSIKDPDEYCQIFRQSLRAGLCQFFDDNFLLYSAKKTPCWYDDIVVNTISTVVESVKHSLSSSLEYTAKNKISEMPSFASTLLPVLCRTNAQCHYVYSSIHKLVMIHREDNEDQQEYKLNLAAFVHLVHTLIQDGKCQKVIFQHKEELNEENVDFHVMFEKLTNEKTQEIDGSKKEGEDLEQENPKGKQQRLSTASSNADDENIVVFEDVNAPVMLEELHEYT